MRRFCFPNGEIVFEESSAHVKSLKAGGEELIDSPLPFFAIKLRSKEGKHRILDAPSFRFVGAVEDSLSYDCPEAKVTLRFEKGIDGLSVFISVSNKTKDVLEWVEWGSVGVFGKLKDEGGVGEILTTYNEGALVSSLSRREASPFPYLEPDYPSEAKYSVFPNMLCAQFISYLKGGKGIYLAMEDESRGTKHIDFRGYGKGIKLQLRAYSNCGYGESYVSDFPLVMRPFEGDFYDACSFYRDWFQAHLPDGCRKVAENPSLPSWYLSSPLVAPYPIRGKFDTDEMAPNGFYPYGNALPILKELSSATDSPVMALLMHWEGTAPWAPPYVYPPFGGSDAFVSFVEEAHEESIFVGLYCSGFGYTLESELIPGYGKEKEYEEGHLSRFMASDSDGRLDSKICLPQRRGLDMCPACEWVKETFSTEIQKCVDLGVDYLQALDQNHGGTSYFCYSDKHGHPPVPGKWQVEEVRKTLGRIHHPHALLGCESGASEPYLGQLLFSDCRFNLNYYFGKPFPVYSFLFHEYLHNFMGNQVCETMEDDDRNYPLRVAYSFLCGDFLAVDLTDRCEVYSSWGANWEKRKMKKDIAFAILKNLNAWRQGRGKPYFNFGRMIRPLNFQCEGKESFRCEDGTVLSFPSVLSARYEESGEKASFLVNYTSAPQPVSFEGGKKIYANPHEGGLEEASSFLIPPYQAIMILG